MSETSAMIRARVVALVVSLGVGACAVGGGGRDAEVRLAVGADGRAAIEVVNVAESLVAAVAAGDLSRDQWTEILRVSVADGQPPMVGTYAASGQTLRFTPMFPLDPGRQYHVAFRPSAIPNGGLNQVRELNATVGLPAVIREPTTTVSALYPSGDRVPANQLRLYVHFSAPMGRKGGLEYITLLDETGAEVVDPFLPLDAEFWNEHRTRYTVFFDPGRQKRGILPNQQMGRSLEPGQRYTLVVSREWHDGEGLPLREEYRKGFTVAPPDERPLDVSQWTIVAPPRNTREPLRVTFPEPLDHGLLLRALGVAGADGAFLEGESSVGPGETTWQFTPSSPWQAAAHQLVALGMLEDLAGNRIGRAFEVDNFDRADASDEVERTAIPFTVR
jgi:hypothetical protein